MADMLGKIVKLVSTMPENILGILYDACQKLSSEDNEIWLYEIKKFFRKETCWVRGKPKPRVRAVDDDGNIHIHFTLTSNGFSCEQWQRHFYRCGWVINSWARSTLGEVSEAPTDGVTYNIVLCLNENEKWSMDERIEKIYASAKKYGWVNSHWEVVFLVNDMFRNEPELLRQLGLQYIITEHKPFKAGGLSIKADYGYVGGPCLFNHLDSPDANLSINRGRGCGFVFFVPQVC